MTMAIIIKKAFLASLSLVLVSDSTTPMGKPIVVFAEADDSGHAAAAQVYISDDNSDNDDGGGAVAADSTVVNNNEEEETAGLILNILVMQTITRWWITKTSLA
jgi:hypothetical protein